MHASVAHEEVSSASGMLTPEACVVDVKLIQGWNELVGVQWIGNVFSRHRILTRSA